MDRTHQEARPLDSTTQIVLRFCLEIEETCARIYGYYADLFKSDQVLGTLWHKIAGEEVNHANIIGMAMRCKGLDLKDKHYDLHKFRSQARIVQDILKGLETMRPSAEDALRAAINLEKRLAEFHLDHVVEFAQGSMAEFFQKLFEGDRQHVAQLEEAYQLLLASRRSF